MRFKKIYVEITNKCNKKCKFCSNSNLPKKEVSLKDFEIVLNKIKPYTDYLYLHVKGEPFFHSKIKEILDLCQKYNYYINITTNGSLLLENVSAIINNPKIRQINISLNSIVSMKELQNIMESVKIINSKTNISIVYRFWALENNILSDFNKKILKEILLFHDSKNRIEDFTNNDNVCIMNNVYVNKGFLFDWPNLNDEIISEKGTCYGTKSQLGILVDGTVVPCCLDGEGIINLGNIYNEELKDIINSDRFIKINKGFNDNKLIEELCKRCNYRLKCIKKYQKSK